MKTKLRTLASLLLILSVFALISIPVGAASIANPPARIDVTTGIDRSASFTFTDEDGDVFVFPVSGGYAEIGDKIYYLDASSCSLTYAGNDQYYASGNVYLIQHFGNFDIYTYTAIGSTSYLWLS